MTTAASSSRQAALVFGGSRGIGAGIARRLASDGFRVALTYATRPDGAAAVVAAIEATGGVATAIHADSADPAAIEAAVTEAEGRHGAAAVAVVNAGVLRLGRLEQVSLADLDLTLAVNVRGVFLAIQAAAARMPDGGRIIIIGSNTAARTGVPGSSVYAMSKAAVAAMGKALALDLAPRRITVNIVQPGPTETDMTAAFVGLADSVPLRRLGTPADVAGLVSYLAGPEASFVTGASLTIDGGHSL